MYNKSKLVALLVSFDIEGAFENAWWPGIKYRLQEKGNPINLRKRVADYLQVRVVKIFCVGWTFVKSTNKGCTPKSYKYLQAAVEDSKSDLGPVLGDHKNKLRCGIRT